MTTRILLILAIGVIALIPAILASIGDREHECTTRRVDDERPCQVQSPPIRTPAIPFSWTQASPNEATEDRRTGVLRPSVRR